MPSTWLLWPARRPRRGEQEPVGAAVVGGCPAPSGATSVRGLTVYEYAWGNNPRRAALKGRRCVVEARGRMGTVLVRFLDTGERVTTSRRALRSQFVVVVSVQV